MSSLFLNSSFFVLKRQEKKAEIAKQSEKTMAKRERKNELKGVVLDLEDLEFFLYSTQQQKEYLECLLKEGDDISLISTFSAIEARFLTLNLLTERILSVEPFTPASSILVSKILDPSIRARDYSRINDTSFYFLYRDRPDGTLHDPYGIAIAPNNAIYICDYWKDRIQVFDSKGKVLFNFGSRGKEPGQFLHPYGITLDHTKQFILITDEDNNRVQIFDLNGKYIRQFGSQGNGDGQFYHPLGITCDQKGNIYIADFGNHRIQIFDQNGNFLRKFGTQGNGNGQLSFPTGIGLLSTGEIVVSELSNRISIFDQDGTLKKHLSQIQLDDHNFICVDPFDRILVADSTQQIIKIFSSNGNFISQFGKGLLEEPRGVAVDANGRILVPSRHTISVF